MSDDSDVQELRQRVLDLDQRLSRIEQAMGQPPVARESVTAKPPRVEAIDVPAVPEFVIPTLDQPLAMEPDSKTTAAVHLPPPLPTPHSLPHPQRSFEATIGLNWTGWIGAIVLVLGVLFFLKFAWDQGWIRPTPTMRVVAAIITGMAISAAGERMHIKRAKVLAATLHGAGLAIVLASMFGAYVLFSQDERVLNAPAAFAGVALTAAAGVMLSLHIRSQVLAIIAFIGAYAAPFVLNTGQDRSVELLVYLGVLGATGAALSYLRPQWAPIRVLAWAGTMGSFVAWWSDMGRRGQHEQLATAALVFYYVLFLVELVLTQRRNDAESQPPSRAGGAILSLLNTALTFAMFRAIYDGPAFDPTMGWIAIGLAMVQGVIAFATQSRAFSLSALLQTAALVTLAVPLLLDQFSITLGWLALAMALTLLAWDLNLPAARAWGIVLLLLSIARLLAFDSSLNRTIVISFGTFSLSQWMMMAWGMAIVAHVIAWLRPGAPGRFPSLERRFAVVLPSIHAMRIPSVTNVLEYAAPVAIPAQRGLDGTGIFASLIGTALFFASSASQYSGSVLTLLMLLWIVPVVSLADRAGGLGYVWHAGLLAFLVGLKWFTGDGIGPLIHHWNRPRPAEVLPPFMNLVLLNGFLLCGLLGGLMIQARRLLRKDDPSPYAVAVCIVLAALAMLNFESCRLVDWIYVRGAGTFDPGIVKHVLMSVLWALVGLTTIVIGFRRDIAPLRYVALALLGATLVKIFLVDMGEVRTVWRILSFIAVGGMLLCVSYVYHRQIEAKQAME